MSCPSRRSLVASYNCFLFFLCWLRQRLHFIYLLSGPHAIIFSKTDDCIGLAVDLWSEVTVSRSDTFEITCEGDGAEDMPTDDSNYMVVGLKAAFDIAKKPMPTLKYHVVSRIPYARGLGSSSAGIVAGIIAGLVLAGHRLPCWGSEALLQVAAGIEVSALLFVFLGGREGSFRNVGFGTITVLLKRSRLTSLFPVVLFSP
jgi:GHMP kinases N terminal domain